MQQKLLVIAHSIAIAALLVNAIAPLYKMLMVLSIAISGWIYWRFYGQKNKTVTVRYTDASGWELLVNNEYRSISILNSTVVTPSVIVLHYRLDNKNRYWAIFYDALSSQGYKQLIIQLKIAGLAKP